METAIQKSNNKRLVFLFAIVGMLRSLIWLSPAPMMTFIMDDMRLSFSQSGMILQIVSVMMGASLFIGSFVIDRLGSSRTFTASLILLGLDGIIGFCSRAFPMLMFGRVMSGVGMGLSMGAMNALIAERFQPKTQGILNSFNLIISSLSMALAYMLSVPLLQLFGSYHSVFLLWAILMLVTAAAFMMADRKHAKKPQTSHVHTSHRAPSLIGAARLKSVWIIAVAMLGTLWVYNIFSAYLPTFLVQERQMSLGMAGAATSVMQVSGIAGGLLWGILLNRGFAFKPILVTPIVLILSGALGTSFITGGILLYVSAFLVGMGYYAFQAASLTVIMQLPGMEPQMMGGATAIYMGLGSLIGIAAPGLFDAIQETNGMQAAMTVFSMLPVLSLAAICVYRDSRTRNEA